ncbi:MAG: DHH family phosphoesterase [Desulfuromonas sp.]|nr:MAG: DHH family phosphoesterase [Desulfuromonas sp.]
MSKTTIKAILDVIDANGRFLVASHESPDGDAYASTLALTLALRGIGKDVVAFNRDGVVAPFGFLPGSDSIVADLEKEKPFDVGFVVDAGELHRAGEGLREKCRILVNIDHHPYSEDFGEYYFVDEQACSTGVLIYRLLKAKELPITTEIAINIYTTILSDTGSFRYSNADSEAFAVASEMIGLGLDAWEIASHLYETQPRERLLLLGDALRTLTISRCGKFASVCVSCEMLSKYNAGPEHTDGFVNYPRSIEGVEVAIFFREISPNLYKVGFRSKGAVDVGALARELGGGGHHNAAGAKVEGSIDTVRNEVFKRLGIL